MSTLWQELRYAARMLWRSPGFLVITIITLALGIGANTAIFSVVQALILTPPKIADPEKVVTIWRTPKNERVPGYLSYLDLQDWRTQNRSFEQIAAYKTNGFTLVSQGQAEQIDGLRVTANFLSILKIKLFRGRDFQPAEEKQGAQGVVIVSYQFWQNRFGRNEAALGQQLSLDGRSFAVIGVLPPDFEFPLAPDHTQLLTTIAGEGQNLSERGAQVLKAIARLKADVTLTEAQTELTAMAENLSQKYPENSRDITAYLVPVDEQIVGQDVRRALWLLLGAVGFILLIACTNITNLLLVRASIRQKELALRAALGAGSYRIAVHLLAESFLLALISGTAGLLLALWGLGAIQYFGADQLPRFNEIRINAQVLLFTLAISAFTALLISLIPILKASRPSVHAALKAGGRNATDTESFKFWREFLVVMEVSLGLILLISAGLMIRSFEKLVHVHPGFDPENVLTAGISMTKAEYEDSGPRVRYIHRTLARLQSLPGVENVAFVAPMPFSGGNVGSDFRIEGRPEPAAGTAPEASNRSVTPEYFQTMKIPLLKGRYFSKQDQQSSTGVAIINAALASRYFPNEDPIGKRISHIGANQNEGDPEQWEIVGVIGDVHHFSLTDEPGPEIYLPYDQNSWTWGNFLIRTTNDPVLMIKSFAETIRSSDRSVPVTDIEPLSESISSTISESRFYTFLFVLFGITGLILTLTGIYGVISYTVTQDTKEIGIRMALGARASDVLRLIVGQGMALAAAGTFLGILVASTITRFLEHLLFDVQTTEPLTYGVIAALVMLMALLASWIPARRATKLDPLVALRFE